MQLEVNLHAFFDEEGAPKDGFYNIVKIQGIRIDGGRACLCLAAQDTVHRPLEEKEA